MDEQEMLKAIPTEVVKGAYDDAISPALKEAGKFGEDVIKTARLVLFPFQYGALMQERLALHLKKSIERVKEDRRVVPIESLALPIIEQFKHHDEESVVGTMFERLLARAMDRELVGQAHPAFVQIVSQLAPDEAVLVEQISTARYSAYMRPPKKGNEPILKDERVALIRKSALSDNQKQRLETIVVRPEELAQPALVYTYIEHLVSVGLIRYTNQPWAAEFLRDMPADLGFDFWFLELSGLGELFYQACLVDE